jgi:hypothetical protein
MVKIGLALIFLLSAGIAEAQTYRDTNGTIVPGYVPLSCPVGGGVCVGPQGSSGSPTTVYSTVDAPFQGAVAMTVGTPGYATQRSIGANCTVSGSMTITLADASTIALPLGVGWQTFPFAVSEVNSSTATCVYSNLK